MSQGIVRIRDLARPFQSPRAEFWLQYTDSGAKLMMAWDGCPAAEVLNIVEVFDPYNLAQRPSETVRFVLGEGVKVHKKGTGFSNPLG